MAVESSRRISSLDKRVRHSVFRQFMKTATGPSVSETAKALDLEPSDVEDSYRRLEAAHALVLAPGTVDIWMCHPFSAVPTPFRVQTDRRDYWANCGWDALGVSAVLGADTRTEVRCPDCGDQLTVTVQDGSLQGTDGVVHFVVPPKEFWDNIGFT